MGDAEKSVLDILQEEEKQPQRNAPPSLNQDTEQPPPSAANANASAIRPVPSSASHGENDISLREVNPVSVRLEHLSVTVDESPSPLAKLFSKGKSGAGATAHGHAKTILDDISGDFQSGSLTAIIGGSGSGKTSLLNEMSGRLKGDRLSVSGRTLFNGSEDASKVRSAYVIQQDILIPTLTVRETLTYAAQLRLPPSISQGERKQLVEEVIMELSLKEAADTRIGDSEHRGCSGGEKRRTSIGVQVRGRRQQPQPRPRN